MIHIRSEGTDLVVEVGIPKDLNKDKDQVYYARVGLGGSDVAVKALANRMSDELDKLIQKIRKEAYAQGAKDRSNKAENFSSVMRTGAFQGGCW